MVASRRRVPLASGHVVIKGGSGRGEGGVD